MDRCCEEPSKAEDCRKSTQLRGTGCEHDRTNSPLQNDSDDLVEIKRIKYVRLYNNEVELKPSCDVSMVDDLPRMRLIVRNAGYPASSRCSAMLVDDDT